MSRPDLQTNFSIITVVFNSVATVRQTIESVLSQDGVSIQYIVIDGGSTDGSVDIVKEYSDRLGYWVSEKDSGIYDAMNKGIAKAKGELVGIINADDWYAPGALAEVWQSFLCSSTAVIHGDMMLVDSSGASLRRLVAPYRPSLQGEFKKMTVNHPATFVPQRLYEQYGYFDVAYRLSADYELILRLLSKNVPFVPLHRITSYFRLGGQSGGVKTYLENFYIQRKYGRSSLGASCWLLTALVKLWLSQNLPTTMLARLTCLRAATKSERD